MDLTEENNNTPKRKRIPGKRVLINEYLPLFDKIEISEPIILQIGKIADELNIKVFIVGGYVRDYFLKRIRTDFDFTVVGDAISFAEEVAKRLNSNALIYPRFRTAMVPYQNIQLEFVGTRKEIYQTDSRNPIVSEGTLEDDIKRRDFTVNAIAASINSNTFGRIYDLFNGRNDLQDKILRTPLNPTITFNDDPLRMIRAARFASQLGFSVDPNCLSAIKELTDRISIISQERITNELLKILSSPVPSIGIKILQETKLLKHVFYEVDNLSGVDIVEIENKNFGHKDIFLHTLQVLDKVAESSNNVWLRFAALVHDVAKPRTKKYINGIGWTFYGHEDIGSKMMDSIFRRLKMPNEHLEYIKKLVKLHQRPMALVSEEISDSAIRRLAFQAGDALEDLFLQIGRASCRERV